MYTHSSTSSGGPSIFFRVRHFLDFTGFSYVVDIVEAPNRCYGHLHPVSTAGRCVCLRHHSASGVRRSKENVPTVLLAYGIAS